MIDPGKYHAESTPYNNRPMHAIPVPPVEFGGPLAIRTPWSRAASRSPSSRRHK